MPTVKPLSADRLTGASEPAAFDFRTTEDIAPLQEVIGQQRAVDAINFGLNMHGPGYHIFVTGAPGTGKTTIVQDIVRKHAGTMPPPDDWCMVNNFDDEYRPRPVRVPGGGSARFARSVHRLVMQLRSRIPQAFEGHDVEKEKAEIEQRYAELKRQVHQQLETTARDRNLHIGKTAGGIQSIPLVDGEPISPEDFQNLPEPRQQAISEQLAAMANDIEAGLRQIQKHNQARQKDLDALMETTARSVVNDRMTMVLEEYRDWEDIRRFLDRMQTDMVDHVRYFLAEPENSKDPSEKSRQETFFRRYAVNVLTDRKDAQGAPVVFEPNPSYQNVFGRIEKRAVMGTLETDFMMVQAGSLLQASGGLLIMEIDSLLTHPGVWDALKRALQNRQVQIEDTTTVAGFGTASLRPEPVPLDVKIVLLGSPGVFQMLQEVDPRFGKIFKVRADFDDETRNSAQATALYAAFVARVCRENQLLPFTADGVAAVIAFGQKSIAHQEKLSLRFGLIADMIKESEYWARQAGAEHVTADHVATARHQHRRRYNLYEERVQAYYLDETVMVDVTGSVIGQVNALAVYQAGELAFGCPTRITAETYMGKQGIINIERESRLSGSTHDKGVLILSGYLGRTFARSFPLSLNISITFEQSYGGIDGDSASSTELYAIMSSLSGAPIQQGIAVTGSVNQKGQIQAIGGVNQKIEGFFDICDARGLTGDQGVIIPRSNVKNLMLKESVIRAASRGSFHIYAVTSVDEGIEILTGVPAGTPDVSGRFPADTIYGRIQTTLLDYYRRTLDIRKARWSSLAGDAPE